MNTIENNKLIAEFMESWHFVDFPNYQKHFYFQQWKFLMPVVMRIKAMGIDEQEPVLFNSLDKIDFVLTCDLSRRNLYKAVVEFIKWYNSDGKVVYPFNEGDGEIIEVKGFGKYQKIDGEIEIGDMAISENGMLNEYVDEDDDLYFINETHTKVIPIEEYNKKKED
jgi:hypothetical protein